MTRCTLQTKHLHCRIWVLMLLLLGCTALGTTLPNLTESPLIKGGTPAIPLTHDLKEAQEIMLEATIGPDNYDHDQAVWGKPHFLMRDGTTIDLTTLKPLAARVGFGELLTNKAHNGPLNIAGEPMTSGFWAHAPSSLIFHIPPGATNFSCHVGLTSPKDRGSVVFKIHSGDQLIQKQRAAAIAASTAKLWDPAAAQRLLTWRLNNATAADEITFLENMAQAIEQLIHSDKTTEEKAIIGMNHLRTLMLERNPAVNFDEILFIKRSGGRYLPQNWQSNSVLPKNGHRNTLCSLTLRGAKAGTLTEIYTPPQQAFIGDIDLHWDAQRILFSSTGTSNAWHVFELDLTTRKARQVSPPNEPTVNHYDACYLPDERIIFTCTALQYAVPCVNGDAPVPNLFRMQADGSALEMLVNDQDHSWCPTMLPDGRVMYSRWEYADIPHANSRILFTCNPDGTNQRALYGSNSFWPNSLFYARPIPNNPLQFIGIVSGHHGLARKGELILFDVSRGTQEAEGVVQRIPGHSQEVIAQVKDQLVNGSWPLFLHPFPLDDTTFLVAMQPRGTRHMGLYLVDRFDNCLPLLIEEGMDLVEPLPLMPTPRPRIQPDRIVRDDPQATIYIANIYEGPGLAKIPPGTVKNLRLYTFTYGFLHQGGLYGSIGMDGPWDMRRILGSVPVNPDGSALFKVPANTPIALQPLDSESKSLQVMRSWFTARNGEYLSCVGCHEATSFTPQNITYRTGTSPSTITPWYGEARNFEFTREVQPILDAYCVSCHNQPDPPAAERFGDKRWKPDLRGDVFIEDHQTKMAGQAPGHMRGKFSVAYANLHRFVRRPGIESDIHLPTPMEWHADTTDLLLLLEKGHHGVQLSPEAYERLITWIDFNAPFHGRWQTIVKASDATRREAQRMEMRQRYAGILEDHEVIETAPPQIAVVIPQKPVPPPVGATTCPDWPFDPTTKPAAQAEALDLGEGVKLELVAVPGGEFLMGSRQGYHDEMPMTRVKVAPFKMGCIEVTNEQFRRFRATHNSRRESRHGYQFGITGYDVNGDQQPAVRLSWQDALEFCAWLSARSGQRVTLPTEAQWEWAARAGSAQPFWYGELTSDFGTKANLADITLAHFSGNPYEQNYKKAYYKNPDNIYDNWIPQIKQVDDGGFLSEPSGSWQPNPWGLYEMHGNVAEWTRTQYQPYPYQEEDGRNALNGTAKRVVRGGSWRDRPKHATASFRRAYHHYQPVYNVGFRVVVE